MTESHEPAVDPVDLASRRSTMLATLLVAVDRRRSRRRRRQLAAGLAAIALLAWSFQRDWRSDSAAPPQAPGSTTPLAKASPLSVESKSDPAPAPRSAHRPVRDEPRIVQRLAIRTDRPSAIAIVRDRALDPGLALGDRDLLEWLRRAGRPSGFLRTHDRFHLTPIAQGD
jgi:hypothetical protein